MRTQLKKLTMYNKVKELSREGLSIRQISRNTGLDRVTVRKYLRMTEEEFSAFLALQKQRNRKLLPYEEFVKKRVTDYPDCSAAQVEDWLKEHHPDLQEVTTRTIYSFVQWIRKSHDIPKQKGIPRYYHPVEQLPYGEQAQVDFGEYWTVNADACKISFQKGFEGYVAFTAKTELIDHYEKTLGACYFKNQRMIIETQASRILVEKYFKI